MGGRVLRVWFLAVILTPAVASERRVQCESAPPVTQREEELSDAPFLGPETNASIGLGGSSGTRSRRCVRRVARREVLANPVELHLRWVGARLGAGPVEDTALALLAMHGAGYSEHRTPETARYAKCIRQGLRAVLCARDGDGCFADRSQQGWLRVHAIATVAISEACWITRNPLYRAPAQSAVDFLEGSAAAGPHDTITTVWTMLALKSARYAGLRVDPQGFTRTRSLLAATSGSIAPAEQAAALLARILLGDSPENLAPLVESVASRLPAWRNDEPPPVDFWYFGTLAMFQVGGARWRQWNEAMVDAIAKQQRPKDAGDLAGTWPLDAGAPVIADQAKLAMCLEVYYRYDRVFGVK